MVPPLAVGADLSPTVSDLTPLVIPNDRFYRIDTSLLTPIVDTAGWTLRIHGLVDRETTLTWDELIAAADVRAVRDHRVRQQRGRGQSRRQRQMDRRPAARGARPWPASRPAATQLVGRSVDGWTAGMPTAWVMDPAREPMIALKMNDEPLPPAHGYPGPADRARPVRLRVGDEVARASWS